MSIDTTLISRARRLDKPALAEIYDRYSPGLYRYAMRLMGDAHLAEDCVADTFSRFLHALARGGGPSKHLQAYLYRVAHNWITDHYRKPVPYHTEINPDNHRAPGANPAQIVGEKFEQQRLRAALAELTPDQRQVIALKFLEGWRNQEIADALGKSIGAVKALQHRSLASLKRILTRVEKPL